MHARALVQRERILVTILLSVSLFSVLSVSTFVHPVKAAGLLYIYPAVTASLPVGNTFSVKVQVANIDPFNAWDISVKSDPTVISPQSLTITGNLLAINFSTTVVEFENCVGGAGTGCQAADGPDTAHSQATGLGPIPQQGPSSGLLFTITYKVLRDTTSALTFVVDSVINGDTNIYVSHADQAGRYGSKLPPVAIFTWSPPSPLAGDLVTFDASKSYDPNPGESIVSYVWDFSNGLAPPPTKNQTIVHRFVENNGSPVAGNFQVTLSIIDTLGIKNSNTTTITVRERKFHDLVLHGIQILNHDDDGILPGTVIHIDVTVLNNGTFSESSWNVTVKINGQALGNPYLYAGNLTRNTPISVPFVWDTTGLKPDSYEILGIVSPAINETQYEPSLANNHLTHYVRLVPPVGSTLVSLSILTTAGLVPVVLIAIAAAIGLIRRVQRSNKQLAEDTL